MPGRWVHRAIVERVQKRGIRQGPPSVAGIYRSLSAGMDAFQQCKKVVDTPFPWPYAQCVMVALILFTVTFPIQVRLYPSDQIRAKPLLISVRCGLWGQCCEVINNPGEHGRLQTRCMPGCVFTPNDAALQWWRPSCLSSGCSSSQWSTLSPRSSRSHSWTTRMVRLGRPFWPVLADNSRSLRVAPSRHSSRESSPLAFPFDTSAQHVLCCSQADLHVDFNEKVWTLVQPRYWRTRWPHKLAEGKDTDPIVPLPEMMEDE